VQHTALSVAASRSRKLTPRADAADASRLLLLLLLLSSWLSLRALPRALVDANASTSSTLQMEQRRPPVKLNAAAAVEELAEEAAEGRVPGTRLTAPAPLRAALRSRSPARIALPLMLLPEPQLLPLEARAWQDQREVELEESPEAVAQ